MSKRFIDLNKKSVIGEIKATSLGIPAYLSEIRSRLVDSLARLSLHCIALGIHIFSIKIVRFFIKTCCFSFSQNILNILPLGMYAVIELSSTRSVG